VTPGFNEASRKGFLQGLALLANQSKQYIKNPAYSGIFYILLRNLNLSLNFGLFELI
jgi:hypothetical protein